jgi:hypothetical protein
MSRKLSVIRVAEVAQTSTPELIRRYAGSDSWTTVGMGRAGVPGHIQTSP